MSSALRVRRPPYHHFLSNNPRQDQWGGGLARAVRVFDALAVYTARPDSRGFFSLPCSLDLAVVKWEMQTMLIE